MPQGSNIDERKYEEVGTNYRFFLGWRHAAFAGYLVVLFGVISVTINAYKGFDPIAPWIPLISSPVGVIFWIIDKRTRDLYWAAIRTGERLEGKEGGFYTELNQNVLAHPHQKERKSKLTHSLALNLLFLGYSIISIMVSLILMPV